MTSQPLKPSDRLARGDKLHMQFVADRRVWWFEEPHQVVPDRVVLALLADPSAGIIPAGDCLFADWPENSQTYLNGSRHDIAP